MIKKGPVYVKKLPPLSMRVCYYCNAWVNNENLYTCFWKHECSNQAEDILQKLSITSKKKDPEEEEEKFALAVSISKGSGKIVKWLSYDTNGKPKDPDEEEEEEPPLAAQIKKDLEEGEFITDIMPFDDVKCECGSETVSGEEATHADYCPKAKK